MLYKNNNQIDCVWLIKEAIRTTFVSCLGLIFFPITYIVWGGAPSHRLDVDNKVKLVKAALPQ